jgi:dCTP deaminase
MILSDREIERAIKERKIRIRPPVQQEHLRPAGVRIHLGPQLLKPRRGQIVDLEAAGDVEHEIIDIRKEPFLLLPGEFVLGSTIESAKTSPGLLMMLDGRSTIARLGLTIHNTASVLDAQPDEWFCPVLEIANHGPLSIRLRLGTPIGMLCFQQILTPPSPRRFHDQYKGQIAIRPPNLSCGARVLADLAEQR